MAKNPNLNDLVVNNEGDYDREPYVGMVFNSEKAAKVFYDAYATQMGFITRAEALSQSIYDGGMTCRGLVCDTEGLCKCSPKQSGNRKGREITREGCKARIVIRKEKTRKWVVTEFFKEHNHRLVIAPVNASRSAQLYQTSASWEWKRELLQGVKAGINLHYRSSIVGQIKSVLQCVGGEETVQRFGSGCFGHLLQFSGGMSCNTSLHALLAREIIAPGARDDEVWFRINDQHIRFSCTEYALVTGLNFGSSTFDPHEAHEMPNGIYQRLLGAAPISIKELEKKFIGQHIRGSADDYLKVANILVLYLMLIGYDTRMHIDEWVWVLVEDAARWNSFPWGAYTFQVLMHYIRILPVHPSDLSAKNSYGFHGPVFALQMWAFEAIPELGSTCAHMDGLVSIPRCLKWSFRRRFVMDYTAFFTRELECMESLLPIGDELVQPFWRSLQDGDPLGVRYVSKGKNKKHGLPVTSRKTSVASRVIQSPDTSADVSVQQSRLLQGRGVNIVETNVEPAEHPTTNATRRKTSVASRDIRLPDTSADVPVQQSRLSRGPGVNVEMKAEPAELPTTATRRKRPVASRVIRSPDASADVLVQQSRLSRGPGLNVEMKAEPAELPTSATRRKTPVASRVIRSPDTSTDVSVQQLRPSQGRGVNIMESSVDPAELPTTALAHDSKPRKTSRTTRPYPTVEGHQRCCDHVCSDTTDFKAWLADKIADQMAEIADQMADKIAERLLLQIKELMEDCVQRLCLEDKKDVEMQELSDELQKSAAFQQQLKSVVKNMEKHSKHIARNVCSIVKNVNEINSHD